MTDIEFRGASSVQKFQPVQLCRQKLDLFKAGELFVCN